MLVRSFYNKPRRHYAHLVIDVERGVAAAVDPLGEDVGDYESAARRAGTRIVLGLQTAARPSDREGLRVLQQTCGATAVAPQRETSQPEDTRIVRVGEIVEAQGLRIEVVANTPPAGPDVAYRIGDTLFTGWTLVRGQPGGASALPGAPEAIESRARRDLDALLKARKLTHREAELAASYLALLDRLGRPPSARELAATRDDLDRGGAHVLIHGIRRKQIALGQVPILLEGQMRKWLRGLQGEPEFTAHERSFLEVYLALVKETGQVPTGHAVRQRLPAGTSIQWVRKRVHTIRRKQAAFGKPPLRMGREPRPRD